MAATHYASAGTTVSPSGRCGSGACWHRVAPAAQHNGAMAPAVAIGGLVVLSLFALALTLRARPRPASRVELRTIWAVPFVSAVVLVVGLVLLLIPGVTPVVVVGLMAYTGVAAAAMWRMARLDRGSRWMEPSQRRARIAISAMALTWLGIILGLLLGIAAAIADGLY